LLIAHRGSIIIRIGQNPESKLVVLPHNTVIFLRVETAQGLKGIVATTIGIGWLLKLCPVLLAFDIVLIQSIMPSSLLVGWW
jgi:hypothetical protein